MLLGEILLQDGSVTREQLASALDRQKGDRAGQRIGEILVELGWITPRRLLEALGEQFGMDCVATIDASMLDSSLVKDLPVDWARAHGVLPVLRGGLRHAALSDPTRIAALDDLSLMLGCDLQPLLAPHEEIIRAIEQCYFNREAAPATTEPRPAAPVNRREVDDLLRNAEQAPVTQYLNNVLLGAVRQGASDVHIEPHQDRVRIRYRVDGVLYEQPAPPAEMEAALTSRIKVMAKLDIAEKRLPQDGTAVVRVGEREIDIRVSTLPVGEGERLVLRLLHRTSALLPLTDLGMPPGLLTQFQKLLKEPHGVILVTGPTGSGKTTTLYAGLTEMDTRQRNILTIEDPVEYQLPDIGQMQVKPKIGLTFAHGLRHILRQDPDVIFVGEIRDTETGEIAIRASLTGHLVFSTLHTNDAASAVVRLVDMGIEPYLLSAALRGILAQRLVRRLCPKCRKPAVLGEEELAALGALAGRVRGQTLWHAVGCGECLGGFRGRTGMYELMVMDEELQDMVRTGRPSAELRRAARAKGMRTMLEDGVEKALQGATTLAEVLRGVGYADAQRMS